MKKDLPTRKQNENLSQNNKKLIKNLAAEVFGILKLKMNCYFQLKNTEIPFFNKQKQNHKKRLNLK